MITYRIDVADAHAHLFQVTLTVARPAAKQRLSLPVWIPGSYLVREFARHLSGLTATQGSARTALVRSVEQLDKATWQVACEGRGALVVSYFVYAFDTSVRAAFLDANRGFFNGTAVCLRVEGSEALPHRLELRTLPAGWQVATALRAAQVDATGCGDYDAADYDELVDHPVELGRFWRGHFTAGGVAHEYVVAGALPDFDGTRLLADAQRICAAQIEFWHGAGAGAPPFERYVFLHNLIEDGHGGLEHRASTALISPRRDMPARGSEPMGRADAGDGYANLLGLISHEYFHTWNVKRLRPAEFARYDYRQENYTELLWFFEGFTSYYDDLFLVRSGLIDRPRYLKLLARTVSGVLASPGRGVQSVAQSSFDSWVKYYRADENTPNATVSYYAKGSLVALALDLTLRREGRGSLDDVMRRLWQTSAGGPVSQADIGAALEHVGGRSYAEELAAWVHGTGELPVLELLAAFGIDSSTDTATLAQRLGLRVTESALVGVRVSHVLRAGAAQVAGVSAGDELLAVNGWRLRRLDDALRVIDTAVAEVAVGEKAAGEAVGGALALLIARDQRVLELAVELPPAGTGAALRLAVSKSGSASAANALAALALQEAWLSD